MGVGSFIKHAWNAFTDQDSTFRSRSQDFGGSYNTRPDRVRFRVSNERSIISSIYTRIGVDLASIDIRHVQLDENGRYKEDRRSGLQDCLTLEANVDQSARAWKQDYVHTLFDEGTVCIVPVETPDAPTETGNFDVENMRLGRIIEWFPQHVIVSLYNEKTGRRENVPFHKRTVGIIENPFYPVMNEPNSTLQRLIRKLNILDAIDEQSGSGKLDLLVHLPYVVKSETRRKQAEERRNDIEFQLRGSKYGIAYTDGTEKVTQLNRPAENNLLKQVEYLTDMLYAQLGITAEVMDGTADEKIMLNYVNRTLEPLLDALTEELKRKFLTKTARTQGQSIMYFRDPFKLVPMSELAEMADKFTRNEIFTSNEIRQFVGVKPSSDPKADKLQNSNMPQPSEPSLVATRPVEQDAIDPYEGINDVLDQVFNDLGAQG